MKVSVIIPTYNRESTLERAIQSVLDQSIPACELLVVDDASTDNTAKILEKYAPHIRSITNSSNRGQSSISAGERRNATVNLTTTLCVLVSSVRLSIRADP